MPSLQLELADDQSRYINSQLLQLRRQMLRHARSWPRGSSERNQRRQTAASLRSLFGNKEWVDAHTVFPIREHHRDQDDWASWLVVVEEHERAWKRQLKSGQQSAPRLALERLSRMPTEA
jgi:hypothetical protein